MSCQQPIPSAVRGWSTGLVKGIWVKDELLLTSPLTFLNHMYFLSFLHFCFILYYICLECIVYTHVHVCVKACAMAGVCSSEDSLWELVLSFSYVSPKGQTEVVKLGGRHAYPLSHLTSPMFSFDGACHYLLSLFKNPSLLNMNTAN